MLKDNQPRSSLEHRRNGPTYEKLNASMIESNKPYFLQQSQTDKNDPKTNVLMRVLKKRRAGGSKDRKSHSPSLLTEFKFTLNNKQLLAKQSLDDNPVVVGGNRRGEKKREIPKGKKSKFVQYKKRKFCKLNPLNSRLRSRNERACRNGDQNCSAKSKLKMKRGKSPLERRPFSRRKALNGKN